MKNTAILGPYPPPYGGIEVLVKEEFEKNNKILIGTSYIPAHSKRMILIPRRRFITNGPVLFFKVFQNRKRINEIEAHYATTFGFVGYLAKKVFGINYRVFCHGSDILQNLKRRVHRYFTMLALENAGEIVVVSNKLKQILIREGFSSEKIKVKKSEIDGKLFSIRRVKKKNQIIFVGSIRDSKGVDLLIDAFSRISDKIPTYKLVIVGRVFNKDYYRKVREMVNEKNLSKRVIFLGEKKRNQIPELLNESKLFVLPSREEGYGLALEEAVSCGLHSIATNVGGIPEIAKKWKNCTLVEPSAEEIAMAILEKVK